MKRWLLGFGAVVLLGSGITLGVLSSGPLGETTTQTLTRTKTRATVRRIVKTKTVKVQPTITRTRTEIYTVTHTETEPPTAGGVYVDYGQYEGIIALHGLQWRSADYEGGGDRVIGQIEYLGAGCDPLPYAQVDATFFDGSGTIIDTGFTNETDLPIGSRFPFELTFDQAVDRGRIELVVTQADC